MAVDWTLPLTRDLTLKSGRQLHTLGDAADLLVDKFASTTKSAPLEHVITLLMRAAGSRTDKDRQAATDQLWTVLHDRRLL